MREDRKRGAGRSKSATDDIVRGPYARLRSLSAESADPTPHGAGSGTGTRVLIVDDHRLFADVIQMFLERMGMHVAVEVSEREGLAAAKRLKPDVALIDLILPDGNGIDLGRLMLGSVPDIKVIALTSVTDARTVSQVMRAGFHGYLTKDTPITSFVGLIESAMAGQVVVPHRLAAGAAGQRSDDERHAALLVDQLSNREREVLAELVAGSSSQEMAKNLGVSPNTVRTHVQSILTKLQVHSRLEAASFAVRFGIGKVPGNQRYSSRSSAFK